MMSITTGISLDRRLVAHQVGICSTSPNAYKPLDWILEFQDFAKKDIVPFLCLLSTNANLNLE